MARFERKYDCDLVRKLSDGVRSSHDISKITGYLAKYIQALQLRYGWRRLKQGAQRGPINPAWKGGRKIDFDGYIVVQAPIDHPSARRAGAILEHRLVMEKILGRYLKPGEVVDHIDGCKLNNDPSNLRLFHNNAAHLRATITGKPHNMSAAGRKNCVGRGNPLPADFRPVDTYGQNKKRGDVRLREILRAREQLGREHPCLSGMEQYQAILDKLSRQEIDRLRAL